MIETTVAAFVGAFAVMLALTEIQLGNKWVKYLVAFVVGLPVAVLLSYFVHWIASLFAHLG